MRFSRLHDLPNRSANDVHLVSGEPISARKITGRTGWPNVGFDVRQGIVDPVKSARSFCGPAIDARHDNQRQNLIGRHVAGVYPFVGLTKKNCASFIAFPVSALSLSDFGALFRRLISPSIASVVSATLSRAMTFSAFIRQPMGAALIRAKKVRIEGLFLSASMTGSHVGNVVLPHKNTTPHWQLPHGAYP